MARWERRFQGGGIYTLLIGPGSCHQPVRKGSIGTGWWHKPVPKVFFSIPKGGKQRPLVPVGGINRYQCYPLVPVGGTNRYHCRALVPVGATNRDSPCATAEQCGGKFSPTSLVEEETEWFISAVARTTSSSSQLQALGPTLLALCLWASWADAGLDPGLLKGF